MVMSRRWISTATCVRRTCRTAQIAWDSASPQMKTYLQRYAAGVAYLARNQLPVDIKLSGIDRHGRR